MQQLPSNNTVIPKLKKAKPCRHIFLIDICPGSKINGACNRLPYLGDSSTSANRSLFTIFN